MNQQVSQNRKLKYTILLLSLGYFIDFYDLTIFSVNYQTLLQTQFQIFDKTILAQTYLLVSNYQTAGIIAGAIFFGIIGDKFGRTKAINYNILLYSITTLLAIFTTSLPIFLGLRFLAYFGLASEFATSSVLVVELFKNKKANQVSGILYAIGVLGGVLATVIGFLSYKAMFIFGGVFGIGLWLCRKSLIESGLYLEVTSNQNISKGNIFKLINTPQNIIKLFKFFTINIPYYVLVSLMFIAPMFMNLSYPAEKVPQILLFGFFTGNLIACGFSMWFNNKVNSYKLILYISFIAYITSFAIFKYIPNNLFFAYCIVFGLIGGTLPIAWIQLVSKSYGTNIRNTASNSLFAMGRGTSIVVNLFLTFFLLHKETFIQNSVIMVVITGALAILGLYFSQETYHQDSKFHDE